MNTMELLLMLALLAAVLLLVFRPTKSQPQIIYMMYPQAEPVRKTGSVLWLLVAGVFFLLSLLPLWR